MKITIIFLTVSQGPSTWSVYMQLSPLSDLSVSLCETTQHIDSDHHSFLC